MVEHWVHPVHSGSVDLAGCLRQQSSSDLARSGMEHGDVPRENMGLLLGSF
jgi:hypothetical protein